jgi:hypothetical protein
VEVEYRCTGAGPVSVRTDQDVIEAALGICLGVPDSGTVALEGD